MFGRKSLEEQVKVYCQVLSSVCVSKYEKKVNDTTIGDTSAQ